MTTAPEHRQLTKRVRCEACRGRGAAFKNGAGCEACGNQGSVLPSPQYWRLVVGSSRPMWQRQLDAHKAAQRRKKT